MDTNNQPQPGTIRLLIVTQHKLDGEILSAQFGAHADICVQYATTDTQIAAAACQAQRPDVVLVVEGQATRNAENDVSAGVQRFGGSSVMLLDEQASNDRLAAVLKSQTVSYFTRAASFTELVDSVRKLARGIRVFCNLVQNRLEWKSTGWHLRSDAPASPWAKLTRRELEIARMVADGKSVRDCAATLHLSPSTVDNHKSRPMKKLGLHKAMELTRLAIRDGLIHV